MFNNLAENAGTGAVKEAGKVLAEGISQGQTAVDEIITRTANEIVTQAAGALTQAAGSVALALGALPNDIAMALHGMKIKGGFEFTITKEGLQ